MFLRALNGLDILGWRHTDILLVAGFCRHLASVYWLHCPVGLSLWWRTGGGSLVASEVVAGVLVRLECLLCNFAEYLVGSHAGVPGCGSDQTLLRFSDFDE